jgi:hypothetical protein
MPDAKHDAAFYDGLAAHLLEDGPDTPYAPAAGRYFDLRRRHQVLSRAKKSMAYRAFYSNPLGRSGFKPPLSLADEGHALRETGKAMIRQGIPVAMERDEKGEHRGTPLADAGQEPQEVLRHYPDLMRRHHTLHKHLTRATEELCRCERALACAIAAGRDDVTLADAQRACLHLGTSRFMLVIPGGLIPPSLAHAGTVTLGYAGGSTCHVGGVESSLPVAWGAGRGIAAVSGEDLHELSSGADVLAVEFLPDKWRGWSGADPQAKPRTFQYPSAT